jgi:8-oxo-dGTP pyrophosphatase MutT (NUDIX family)
MAGMTERVRAILITPRRELLTIRRIKPDRPPYWVLPGGGVEPGDASLEEALHREIHEELAGRADICSLVRILDEGRDRQYIYLARISEYDFAARTGPEFGEAGRGRYFLDVIPLTATGLAGVTLIPAAIAGLLDQSVNSGLDLFELPDLRRHSGKRNQGEHAMVVLLKRAFGPRIAIPVAAVIVLCLVVTGIVVKANYHPIQLGLSVDGLFVAHADGTPADNAIKDMSFGGDDSAISTPTVTLVEPNMTVSVFSTLSLRGRFSVEILDVATPFGSLGSVTRKILVGDSHGGPATRPFRKFTLHPGDTRMLTQVISPKLCPGPADPHAQGYAISGAQKITYRFLGMTHHAMVSYRGAGFGVTGSLSCSSPG